MIAEEEKKKKIEQSLQETRNTLTAPNIHIMGIPGGERENFQKRHGCKLPRLKTKTSHTFRKLNGLQLGYIRTELQRHIKKC